MTEAIVVFMTASSVEEARRIAERLIDAKLAACVQILPEIESVYRWENVVKREKELLILAKTTADRFSELEKQVRERHSYKTPEIIAVAVTKVSAPYREWLLNEVKRDS